MKEKKSFILTNTLYFSISLIFRTISILIKLSMTKGNFKKGSLESMRLSLCLKEKIPGKFQRTG